MFCPLSVSFHISPIVNIAINHNVEVQASYAANVGIAHVIAPTRRLDLC